jgi:hypothetical protein
MSRLHDPFTVMRSGRAVAMDTRPVDGSQQRA